MSEVDRLQDIFLKIVQSGKDRQARNGSMPSGWNGPYHDEETPVRNTSHWCINFLTAWELTGEREFLVACERAAEYVKGPEARPYGRALVSRTSSGKDHTNGVIGQAWAIEALAEAGRRLGREDLLRVARDLFVTHPYSFDQGGWRRVQLDGTPSDFDRTFNHQLWFCAAGAVLMSGGVSEVSACVRDFVERLPGSMSTYNNGLIRHANPGFLSRGVRGWPARTARRMKYRSEAGKLYDKSIGYHSFNTYALAVIHNACPELRLDQSPKVISALKYIESPEYIDAIQENRFGFPYNPPGIEAAMSVASLGSGSVDRVNWWLNWQIRESYESYDGRFVGRASDPNTCEARLYEASRLFERSEQAGNRSVSCT